MKILMLNYEFPPIGGGAGAAHLSLLKEYARRNNLTVDVLTCGVGAGLKTEKFSENITVYRVGVYKKDLHFWRRGEVLEWLFKGWFHYRRLIRQNGYDLTHAFFGFPTGLFCYLSRAELDYIISLRGSDVPGGNVRLSLDYKILGPLFRVIWKNAAVLVANSEGLKKRALRFLPSVSIDVITNGVDCKRFLPRDVTVESDTNELRLITVGRLSVTKRFEMLIDAVDILLKQGRQVRLQIVGGGREHPALEKMVIQKKLLDAVEIVGRVEAEKMPELYRQSDLFVSASMQEGMSNAMLEAMACGLAIVTTPCEGIDELITDNGIVVETDIAASIAEAVGRLIDDRQRYVKMCTEARKRAGQFGWSQVADMYISHYEQILKNRSAG